MDVLALDCQATGANPERGALLEVGWAQLRANESGPSIETRLVRSLAGAGVPRHIQRITGISRNDLRDALHPRQVWEELSEAASRVAGAAARRECPTVVHFSRYEEPFLRALHADWSVGSAPRFPFELICTHQLARRLLPTLPRKGLRAVAGYFGHGVGELRRARDHVAATGVVWSALVPLLEDLGLRDLSDLRAWLERAPLAPMQRCYPMAPALRLAVPNRPGIYRLRRAGGEVLYVGKARSLKRRVNSYFQKRGAHSERTLEMLSQARGVDVSVTGSALEAALLEADEIKRLRPPYNVALRERGRRLAFASADLSAFGPRPDQRLSVGPFPSRQALAPFAALARQLEAHGKRRPGRRFAPDVLGSSRRVAPEAESLAEGLRLFFERHGEPRCRTRVVPWMLLLGARLRRVELGRSQKRADERELRELEWTPERVTRAVETVVDSGARLVRRARWLCRLSESALSWEHPHGSRSALVVSAGEVADGVPDSPSYTRPLLERQGSFDLARYDRLSVLTRELRSLVVEAPSLELRFTRGRVLDRAAVSRALRWV